MTAFVMLARYCCESSTFMLLGSRHDHGQALVAFRQGRRDAFHVFVYGPRRERIGRIGWDRRREAYIRRHFGQEWTNPHLYGLMLCSSMAETAAVAAILAAVRS